jgi:hypothetical protein
MHIITETAFDLLEGRLENALARRWNDHLATCTLCSSELDAFQSFRESLKRPHLERAPDRMLSSAVALFQTPRQAKEPVPFRRIFASLAFDNLAQPAFVGARGETATATRQVVLRAEEFDIHVRVWVTNESRELLGQIQARGTKTFVESARLHLLQNGERVSSAEVNNLGEFHFSYVPDGLLSLQIDLPHLTVIGALDLNDRI